MASEFDTTDLNDPELETLAVALRDNRPEPEAAFAEKLDTAVADHFPPEWSIDAAERKDSGILTRARRWLGAGRPYLLPLNAGIIGLAFVVVAVGIGMNNDGGTDTTTSSSDSSAVTESAAQSSGGSAGGRTSGTVENSTSNPTPGSPELYSLNDQSAGASAGNQSYDANGDYARVRPDSRRFLRAGKQIELTDLGKATRTSKSPGAFAAGVDKRKVAQDVDITLGTDPESVQDVTNEVVGVVDDHNGIVLDSSVKDGPVGQAGANFSLMIPSAQLESAVSDLSGIADLKSRSQETEDITAPTLTVEDSLRDSRARIDSLVKELSEATTDEDRTRIEDELAQERRQAARLNTRLNKLERRANLTPVGLTVETGGDSSSGDDDSSWGIGDAIDDAGNMLGISAGVALIALAIGVPIGLMVLIALALNRAWIRHSRRRALEEN